MKYLMQLPNKQTAIATHLTLDAQELIYYLCHRIFILESQVSDLKRQNRQIIHTQEIQEMKTNQIEESIDVLMFDYRYQKAHNDDLESELSFFKPPED